MTRIGWMPVLSLLLLAGCTSGAPFQQDDRIVFFGDSITEAGDRPGGYVTLVREQLTARYPDLNLQVIGAGISGNKIGDLLARVDRDVLRHDPTTVVVYIGINDVWHWEKHSGTGTTEADFDAGLRELVGTLHGAGADVVLCTPSVIGEKPDGTNPQDDMLDRYAQISRTVAAETGAHLCDLRAAFIDHLQTNNPDRAAEGILTTDGVHLNDAGNAFVADQMIAALEQRGR